VADLDRVKLLDELRALAQELDAFVEVSPNVVNARALESAYRRNTAGDDRVRPGHAALTGTITFEPVTYKVRNFRCSALFWPPRHAAKIRAWARKNIPGRAWRRWSTARLRRIWFKAEAARMAREMRTFPDALGATLADAAAEFGRTLIDGLTCASEVHGG
jgi:hypothetical protein